jgi:hypothetical protein
VKGGSSLPYQVRENLLKAVSKQGAKCTILGLEHTLFKSASVNDARCAEVKEMCTHGPSAMDKQTVGSRSDRKVGLMSSNGGQ